MSSSPALSLASRVVAAVFVAACVAPSGAAAGTPAPGIGSARASAIPIRAELAGISADLIDVSLAATTDPQRQGKSRRTAEASLTALRIGGPQPVSAGRVESSAVEGEAQHDSTAIVPLSEPGVVTATLQAANATSMVDETGSYASAGASLTGISLGGNLLVIDLATASLSVSATATSVSASKILDIPVVTALRVGDVAGVAGTAIDALSLEALLSIANTLSLETSGALGDALAQHQAHADVVASAEQQLEGAIAERAAAVDLRDEASDALEALLAGLLPLQDARDAATAAVDTALTELAAAESAHASAFASLQEAKGDQATLSSLTLLTPGAVGILQAIADEYGVPVEVSGLNFLTSIVVVAAAVDAAVAAAEDVEDDAASALAAAQTTKAQAESALQAAQAAMTGLEEAIGAAQADLASRASAVVSLDEAVAALEAALAGLQTVLAALAGEVAVFVDDLRTLVQGASVVRFEGIHIELHASASADGGSPGTTVSFDRLSLGDVEAAQDVSGVEAAAELLPRVAAAVNGVGAAFGLPVFQVGMLQPSSASGIDAEGYRYASAGFSLFRVEVPTPDGHALMLEVGDPEVFAEFAPASSDPGPPGKPKPAVRERGAPAGVRLPSTGLPATPLVGLAMLLAAVASAAGLRRRRI